MSGGDLTAGFKATIASVAIACAATAFGAVGTAYAATPSAAGATSVLRQNPPPRPPPHRFHSKFRTIQQCEQAANHDHPGRHDLWDCRRGPDRNNPWEYWGN
jgi:hypothetical protein